MMTMSGSPKDILTAARVKLGGNVALIMIYTDGSEDPLALLCDLETPGLAAPCGQLVGQELAKLAGEPYRVPGGEEVMTLCSAVFDLIGEGQG